MTSLRRTKKKAEVQMSLSNTTTRQLFTGDDSTVVFAIPFDIIDSDSTEVDVYLVTTSTGAAVLQTESTHYTLTDLSGSFYTNVTMTTAPASTEKLLIIRNIALTQTLDIDESGDFPAESLEKALDRMCAQIQFLNEKVNRALKFSTQSAQTNIDVPEPVADKLLGWDSAGTGLENEDPS